MAWENASTSAAIQSVRESYCSGICSVSSTIGILDDLAAVTILRVSAVSAYLLTTGRPNLLDSSR